MTAETCLPGTFMNKAKRAGNVVCMQYIFYTRSAQYFILKKEAGRFAEMSVKLSHTAR
jgi:hypothetical protein